MEDLGYLAVDFCILADKRMVSENIEVAVAVIPVYLLNEITVRPTVITAAQVHAETITLLSLCGYEDN